jgi:hypothetical protein
VPVPASACASCGRSLLLAFSLGAAHAALAARHGRARPARPCARCWRGWLGSFRARVTVALFGFFLVPTAVFGWAAYSALAGEVARAAERVAQHSVNQAVIEFEDAGGDLRRLAMHAGTDVLRYHGGELIDVSSREALDLGVYSAWMPPHVYQRHRVGRGARGARDADARRHSFVTAYRAMPPTGTLGVPMSLSAGDAAVRLRELAHLVLFAAVVGALLSLGLSVAVGRALAGPIGQLRRAAPPSAPAASVSGCPSAGDEFGQLFASFNRMDAAAAPRPRPRAAHGARPGLGRDGAAGRPRDQEPAHADQAVRAAPARAHADRHPQFDEILDSNVSQILAEIDRLSEIARAFSRYGAPGFAAGPLTAVDVPDVIREALTLYRSGDRA